ncbi:MAG: DUF3459 domain-containing protein, partial [Acetobacteraceae bacterium]
GCRSEGAEVLGEGAVLARWRLGDGAALAIAVNLGTREATVATIPARTLLFESAPGADVAVASGRLPPQSAVVRLGPMP